MIEHGIPGLIGILSNDLMLVCDGSYVVQEANTMALDLLGPDIIGQPLPHLLHDMSQTKGRSFFEHARGVAVGSTSESWELMFQPSHGNPMLINVRAGRCQQQQWLFVGTYESPQFTALYHEVLAMNSELTNLIRQLSKEQARLSNQLARLLETEEHHYG